MQLNQINLCSKNFTSPVAGRDKSLALAVKKKNPRASDDFKLMGQGQVPQAIKSVVFLSSWSCLLPFPTVPQFPPPTGLGCSCGVAQH